MSESKSDSLPAHPLDSSDERRSDVAEPIAIVGIGCRYADARGPDEFWEIVRSGRNTVRDVPQHRIDLGYDIDHFYDPRLKIPGKISSRKAGFLEHPELFDPAAFGIAPRDALTMEPQQRLMIEVTWDALEDAGIVPESIVGERVSVILGYMAEDYSRERTGVLGEEAVFRGHDVFTVGGMSHAVLSGRIAYLLGVTGPSFTLDTACSSSLITTHLACQSLRRGESKMAIAGGANLFLSPEGNIALSRSGMLSMSGACKAFDASADGFVRAEGAGVVVLRPLADALAEGNPVYAVIRGSGISTDGRDGGHMMAPGRKGQAQAMRDAYAQSGVSPSEVHYVETHGTGTMIGDPVEIGALADVMGPGRPADKPLLVASVKGNLGHTESASGVAGLIKAALSIRHRQLPAQLHFETPSPAIPWDDIPVRVQSEMTPWPYPGKALVGVNSFGISGTNAHVVLESPPEAAARPARPAGLQRRLLLPITGHESKSLHAMAAQTRDALATIDDEDLEDFAYTLGRRRTHRAHRLSVVAGSAEEMRQELAAYLEGSPFTSVRSGAVTQDASKKLVMVFPGQGGQWLGMGRGLLESEPVFAASIDRLDAAYQAYVNWSLRAMLEGRDDIDWTTRLDLLQPILVAVEIALAELWESWGIRPDRVIGQSMGEIAAAYVAGCLRLDDMARLACHRGLIVAQASGRGAMAVVAQSRDALQDAITQACGRVEIAGSNSPSTTILSGDREAVDSFVAEFEERGIFARMLEVDFASHCFHMDPLLESFRESIGGIEPQPARIPFDSTVDGSAKQGEDLDSEYWVRNLRAAVAFDQGFASALEAGGEVFLEVSPHPVLARSIEENAGSLGRSVSFVSSIQRDHDEQGAMLTSLGELFVAGMAVDFASLYPTGRVVNAPLYAYQRERYWFSERTRSNRFRPVHPLLGARSQSSLDPRLYSWDFLLDHDSAGFVRDYRVGDQSGVPASLYPEIALAVGAAMWPGESIAIEAFEFNEGLIFEASNRCNIQASLMTAGDRAGELKISSRGDETSGWALHTTCRIAPVDASRPASSAASLVRASSESRPSDGYYSMLERSGLSLGPRCRTLRELEAESSSGAGVTSFLARMMLPRISESEWYAYHAHPAILENCFQLVGSFFESAAGVRPLGIDRIAFDRSLGSDCWCRVSPRAMRASGMPSSGRIEADLEFYDRDGEWIGRIEGMRVEARPIETGQEVLQDSDLYRMEWLDAEWPRSASGFEIATRAVERWIVVSDSAAEAGIFATELEKQGGSSVFCEKIEDLPPLVAQMQAEPTRSWGFLLLAWAHSPTGAALEPLAYRDFRVASWARAIRDHCGDAAQVWIATRGLQRVLPGEGDSGGVARLIAQEVESFASCVDMQRCRLFDASAGLEYSERVALASLIGAESEERQWAVRDEKLLVPRLVSADVSVPSRSAQTIVAGERNFRAIHARREGLDCVALEEIPDPELEPNHVLVEVVAASLTQLDVLNGLGLARENPADANRLGADFSGRVIGLSAPDSGLEIGDEVLGVASGALARRIAVPVSAIAKKPASLDDRDAASLPFPYLVATYALEVVGRLRAGERVLILSAAGGVGQAMVGVARANGAEVFATASRPDRRAALRRLGACVLEEGSDSCAAEWADFDVIVASESGDRLHSMLTRLAPGGRYLDLCPRNDFIRPELGAIRLGANRSVSSIDIGAMMQSEPTLVSSILERIATEVSMDRHAAIDATVFPLSQVSRAIRYMSQNRHLGRVSLDLANPAEARIRPRDASSSTLASAGPFIVSRGELAKGDAAEVQIAIVDWLRNQGVEEIIESTSSGLAGVLDAYSAASASADSRIAGWVHVVSESERGAAEIEQLAPALASGNLDFRAVVSIRDALGGDATNDRAWETRVWIDRLLLSDACQIGRVATLSVGSVADDLGPRRVADLVGQCFLGDEVDVALIDLPEGDLNILFAEQPSPTLARVSSPSGGRAGTILLRSEWMSLPPPERPSAMQEFVRGALAGVLGLADEQRDAIEMGSRIDEIGLDSLMTLELFMGLGRDLELEIGADWFGASPTLGVVAEVLLDRLEESVPGEGT